MLVRALATKNAAKHTGISSPHGLGFFNQIDLEADIVPINTRVPLDGDHRDEIHEGLSTLAVVNYTGLDLTAIVDG